MECLVIIPARGGSKGIPHKNIKPLNGKPLIRSNLADQVLQKRLDFGRDNLSAVLYTPYHMVVYIADARPVFNDICFHVYSITRFSE